MSKLQLIDAKAMEKLISKIGFVKTRQKGSPAFYRHSDGRYTTIPFHSNKDLGRSLIHDILNQIKVSVEEYNQLLKDL